MESIDRRMPVKGVRPLWFFHQTTPLRAVSVARPGRVRVTRGRRPRGRPEADAFRDRGRGRGAPPSPLRYLFRGAADPLLVDLLVGAVFLYLGQGLVDGLDEGALLGEGDTVLGARGDHLDKLQRPFGFVDLLLGGGEVVDHPVHLLPLERVEGVVYGTWEGAHRLDVAGVQELPGLGLAHRAGLDAKGHPLKVAGRIYLRAAADDERLVDVVVGVREVHLLAAVVGDGHAGDHRVEEVRAESPQEAVELDVPVLDLKAGPIGHLVHQVDVEALGALARGELERRVGDVGGDDYLAVGQRRARGLLLPHDVRRGRLVLARAASRRRKEGAEDERRRQEPHRPPSHPESSLPRLRPGASADRAGRAWRSVHAILFSRPHPVKTPGAHATLRRAAIQAPFEAVRQVDQGQADGQVEAAFRRFY